jgi:hypothetical protein
MPTISGEDGATPLADLRLGEPDVAQGIPAMRGDETTVFWLSADTLEHLPNSRVAWEEGFRMAPEPEPELDAEGAAMSPASEASPEPEAGAPPQP